MIDWSIVFKSRKNKIILIPQEQDNYLSLFYKYQQHIESYPNFYCLLPTQQEIKSLSSLEYSKKYIPLFKNFMDSNKNIILTEELIFNGLNSEDKQISLFKYFLKNNKTVIIFFKDFNFYNLISLNFKDYVFLLSTDDIQLQLSLFDRFDLIKKILKENPFSSN